ncbi:hypothetical protein FVB32_14140 [Flagellimonas hymeniacidonis]|uniref:Uncharacterized protein n=1 Tax=Flagellimonas hymeniacidonis TaxID=2603628 RepID=A0A5C8V3P4_9FLAO|nr:hypothetical protein [Flagellimonas hymeniacidonis]TXN35709.1 hypothetical protein FVB32_14140 [Flagellimonas hymeniacidonis]
MKQGNNELSNDDLTPLLSYFEECHEGDLLSLTQSLDKTIFMLHFIPMDTFSDLERQNCCHVLMELKEAVMEIYLNKKDN